MEKTHNDLKMNPASKILLVVTLLLVIVIGANRYREYVTLGNFLVDVNVPCAVADSSCFVVDCDPADSSCDPTPYLKAELLAKDTPQCVFEHACSDFKCPTGAKGCAITTCSTDTLGDGERCLDGKSGTSTQLSN